MVWRCYCATKTKASTLTPMDASSRTLSCSGARCLHLSVWVKWNTGHRANGLCELCLFVSNVPLCSLAHICSNQIMGWGEKAIEIRSVETGHLDGVFMHKRAQRLKFLCERNDKVTLSWKGDTDTSININLTNWNLWCWRISSILSSVQKIWTELGAIR